MSLSAFTSMRGVDVADDGVIGIIAPELAHRLDRAAIHQAATGAAVGDHDHAVGIERLGGFGHEPHAAKGDHVAFEITGLARQLQAVADDVGQLLDLGFLVVMRQQDGVAALFQFQDLFGDSGRGQHGDETAAPGGRFAGRPRGTGWIPLPLILSATVGQASRPDMTRAGHDAGRACPAPTPRPDPSRSGSPDRGTASTPRPSGTPPRRDKT